MDGCSGQAGVGVRQCCQRRLSPVGLQCCFILPVCRSFANFMIPFQMNIQSTTLFWTIVFFLTCLTFDASAGESDLDASITIETHKQSFFINRDGSFDVTVFEKMHINQERAIRVHAQRYISYNRTLDVLDGIEAFTEKPDGRRIPVRPDQIKDQQEARSIDAPMFQDTRLKIVIFPEVEVDDTLVLQYELHRKTALFPGQFELLIAPEFHPYKEFSLVFNLPVEMPLYADATGFLSSTPSAPIGRKRYQWSYSPSNKQRIEQGSVSYLDYGDRIAVSTFTDFPNFAKAFDSFAARGAVVTPKIETLAQAITKDLSDQRAKVMTLTNWVRKNIRYVAVYVGDGGVVPHDAETVLGNRYGDCKDHVVLLEALLSAVGINSTPALVNLGNAYKIPAKPTLGVLNHVINYVPALELFVDSTADSITAGYLPVQLLDKPVLLTKTGKFSHTPASQEGATAFHTDLTVRKNGSADFRHEFVSYGWLSEMNHAGIDNLSSSERNLLVKQALQKYGQTGSGELITSYDRNAEKYNVAVKGNIENLLNLPGPVGVTALTSFVGGIADVLNQFGSERRRNQPFVCLSGEIRENSTFAFPNEISIVAVPKGIMLQNSYIDFRSEYIRGTNMITVLRHYKFHHQGAVCNAKESRTIEDSFDKIINDLHSQIIVQAI